MADDGKITLPPPVQSKITSYENNLFRTPDVNQNIQSFSRGQAW